MVAEPTLSERRKATVVAPTVAWCGCSAGVEEQGMVARVTQEPGRAQSFLVERRGAGAAIEVAQIAVGLGPADGREQDR